MKDLAPCLLFVGPQCGRAEEAIGVYVGLFAGSKVEEIARFGPGEPGGAEGQVKTAFFTLGGRPFRAMDSSAAHAFAFSPAISFFIECDGAEEQQRAYDTLVEGGKALMPLGDYGFSTRFGWVEDRFGVSWQLNLV